MKLCLACSKRFEAADWRCPSCAYTPPCPDGYPVFAPELVRGDGFDADYTYAELFEVEAGNFWFRARNQLLIWVLKQYFSEARNFLEIGCGTGFVLSGIQQACPGLTLSASDILVRGLGYAKRRLVDVSFMQMDARRIPFEAEFDVVGTFDMIEHIQEDELVLSQMFQATKPGGGIMLTAPRHPFLWSVYDEVGHHKRRYTRSELITKIIRTGFEVVRVISFVSLLLPLMWLSRLKQRQGSANYDVMAEFKISPIVNKTLEKILTIERLFITRGLSFPAGGSLFVIAKRPLK